MLILFYGSLELYAEVNPHALKWPIILSAIVVEKMHICHWVGHFANLSQCLLAVTSVNY
jgi:hypothetical protein